MGRRPATTEAPNRAAELNRQHRRKKVETKAVAEDLSRRAQKYFDQTDSTDKVKQGAAVVAEKLTRQAMRSLAPSQGMFTPEIMEEARQMSRDALLTMVGAIPRLTQIVIERAEKGDPSCLAVVARWLPSPQDALSLTIPQGMTREEASEHLVGSALSGQMTVKEAKQGLELLQASSNLELSQAMTARLAALRARLEKIQGVVQTDTLSSAPIAPKKRLTADGDIEDIETEDAPDAKGAPDASE